MDISDIINILGIIISFAGGLVSIGIATTTLIQNSKAMKEYLKPDMHTYMDYSNSSEKELKIIIKNYGRTGVRIPTVSYSCEYITNSDKFKQPEQFVKKLTRENLYIPAGAKEYLLLSKEHLHLFREFYLNEWYFYKDRLENSYQTIKVHFEYEYNNKYIVYNNAIKIDFSYIMETYNF